MENDTPDLEAVREEIAPSGTLVCALNHGNVVLVRRGRSDEHPSGVSVDLARSLADTLGLPIKFRHYDKAGAVSASAGTGEWDVCFLAIDPKRAEQIAYSSPYVQIEGAFLVQKGGPFDTPEDVFRLGPKIGVVAGSAYELHLSRTGQGGELMLFDTPEAAIEALEAGELSGLAGVRQAMQKVADTYPRFEVMKRSFMAIPQAMGVSVSRPLAANFVKAFVDERKSEGFVHSSLVRSGHGDVTVPA